MIAFSSTEDFRISLEKLTKKPKDGYSGVVNEICLDFINKPIEDIRNNRDMVLSEDSFTVIKLRLPDSSKNLGKSNGYRLIYFVHKIEEQVTFLYVYPKRGAYSLVNLSSQQIKDLLTRYKDEKKKNMLVDHNINNNLEKILRESEINVPF